MKRIISNIILLLFLTNSFGQNFIPTILLLKQNFKTAASAKDSSKIISPLTVYKIADLNNDGKLDGIVNFTFVLNKSDLNRRLGIENTGVPPMKALLIMKFKGYAVYINDGVKLELKYYDYKFGYGELKNVKNGIISNYIEDYLDTDRYNNPSIKIMQKLKWQDNSLVLQN